MRYTSPIAVVVLLVSQLAFAASEENALVSAVECRPRAGLPNFLAKLKGGQEVRIGYFGGSITAQEGWRPKTRAYFEKLYPQAKVSQINAAIGGTGSDLGVFRLKHDVLDQNPDLIFVEFAVNDGGAPPAQIHRCMEGIVRQTWNALPECDICFVYTLVAGFAPTLQEGKFPAAASAMEKIADHYGIPSVHMGLEVARMAADGKLIFQGPLPKTDEEKRAAGDKIVFSPDSVHPYPETGHELYLQAIVRSLPAIEKASTQKGRHALPAAFRADNYERAQMIPLDKLKLSAGIQPLDKSQSLAKRFVERVGTLYRGNQPGETIRFKFRGTRAAIYDIIGPDCGQVSVTLDDKPAAVRPRFDAYCSYHRLATLPIGTELDDAVHTVTIEIHPDQPDKAKILSQRKQTIDDPKRFDDRAFYPGALLLVGELVE